VVEKSRIPAKQSRDFANWTLPAIETGQPIEAGARPQKDKADEPISRTLTARQLEEITAQAHREGFAHGAKEGRAAGFTQGQQEGRAAAQDELAQQVAQLRRTMAELQAPIADQSDAIEAALAQLALDIARAVLAREPALAPRELIPIVRRAVRELPVGERNLTVLLNPAQLELIRDCEEWPAAWRVQADGRIDNGGCKVIAEHSLVDYTIELRFRQIAAQLLAESANAEPPEPGALLDDADD
jgi:flagellar assembly protein FliH